MHKTLGSLLLSATLSFALVSACGDDDGGGVDSGADSGVPADTGSGSDTGTGSDASTPSPCESGCPAAIAAACSNGPPSLDECIATCEGLRVGDCGTEYEALLRCNTDSDVTCDPESGIPIVSACATEQQAFIACING